MAKIRLKIDIFNGDTYPDGMCEKKVRHWIGYANASTQDVVEFLIGSDFYFLAWRMAVLDKLVKSEDVEVIDAKGHVFQINPGGRLHNVNKGQSYPDGLDLQSPMLARIIG